jgi:hypothetical protein
MVAIVRLKVDDKLIVQFGIELVLVLRVGPPPGLYGLV